MGSLPEGTLCAYCGVREAGYIPDGCCGPVCFDEKVGCWDVAQSSGWEVVEAMRLKRLWQGLVVKLSKHNQPRVVFGNHTVQLIVASFLWRT